MLEFACFFGYAQGQVCDLRTPEQAGFEDEYRAHARVPVLVANEPAPADGRKSAKKSEEEEETTFSLGWSVGDLAWFDSTGPIQPDKQQPQC